MMRMMMMRMMMMRMMMMMMMMWMMMMMNDTSSRLLFIMHEHLFCGSVIPSGQAFSKTYCMAKGSHANCTWHE